MLYVHILLDLIQESFDKRKTSRATAQVPKRLMHRWLREADNKSLQHHISRALATVGISRKEFTLRLRRVQPEIPDDELFSMYNKAFGTPGDLVPKLKFVQEILRRYKAITTKKVRGNLRLFDHVIFEYSSFLIGTFMLA